MGLVLTFEPSLARTSRSDGNTLCQITIFPGVRYERHVEAETASAGKPAGPEKPPLGRRKKR